MSPFSFLTSSSTAFRPVSGSYAAMNFWIAFWSLPRYIEKCAARTSDGAGKRSSPTAVVVPAAAAVVAAGADVVLAAAFLLSDGNLPANTKPATGSTSTATAIARRRRNTLSI